MCERIEWSRTNVRVKRITVKWDWDEPEYIVNPKREATEEEYLAVPKLFVCLACNERHAKADLGGKVAEKWICRFCIPYVDEWTAGTIIWFDGYKIKHPNAKPAKKEYPPRLSDKERMAAVVRWAKRENKPLL